jgi:hypothetical protein
MKLFPVINTDAEIPEELSIPLFRVEVRMSLIGRPLMTTEQVVEKLEEVCDKETAALFKPEYFLIAEKPFDFE